MTLGAEPGPLWVVAGALRSSEDSWLMQQRPLGKHHAGLWEFPGGKVEETEIPAKALVRELREELGIEVDVSDCVPYTFAEELHQGGEQKGARPIVILLYTISIWSGKPQALEGGRIEWFRPEEIANLEKPPLDRELAGRLFADGL